MKPGSILFLLAARSPDVDIVSGERRPALILEPSLLVGK